MGKARFGTAIGAIGATFGHYRGYRSYRTVRERPHTGSTIGHYRRGHYRTIGEGTIGLSELSDYYRSAIGVYYRNYRTGAQHLSY